MPPIDSLDADRRVVLVVDDDREIRALVSEVLAEAGLQTAEAGDGREAIELALSQPPALIVLDVIMPDMDGYTTLTRLRGHPRTGDIPVVVMTGQGGARYRELSLGVGALAHVAKPFSPSVLVETVGRLLADREMRERTERRLGDVLVGRGWLTGEQLDALQATQQNEGKTLQQVLHESGAIPAEQLSTALAEILEIPYLGFADGIVAFDLARGLPEEMLRRHRAVPVGRPGQAPGLALADPTDRYAIGEIQARLGSSLRLVAASPDTIQRWLDEAFPPDATAARGRGGTPPPAVTGEVDPTGIAEVYALLLGALRDGASEILVEPLPDAVRVRGRVDGRLVERARRPRGALEPILARLRVLAGLRDESSPIQAYVRTRLQSEEVELELLFSPTLHGDAVTVKLWRGGLVEADPILGAAVSANASDVYLLEGTPPVLKVDGAAIPLAGAPPLTPADLRKLVLRFLSETQRRALETVGGVDLSHLHETWGRFRVNCYRAMGATGMVLRRVKTEVPTFDGLELPPVLGALAMERQGLILVVGATGSGKSTTLAAMLDYRNSRAPGHIVTIEDPVEFIHARKQSVISQREVGIDTESYLLALKEALRQAPDVIFVGELRDSETVATALHAAETGHLVLSTLHATNATGAVERLLNFFPPVARESILMQISITLRAIIAQRLIPRAEGKGRVAAMEILLNTSRIQSLIRRGELENVRQAIEEGVHEGLQTLDQALLALSQQSKITQDEALRFADSPNNLRLRIRGIR
jgi:pilus retraction protein PilT